MKTIYLILTIFYFVTSSFAQSGKITGIITDEFSNKGIPFANVVISGTNQGTITDEFGKFEIGGLNAGYYTITASYIGYETVQSNDILVTNSVPGRVEVKMKSTDLQIEEVKIQVSPFRKTEDAPVSLQKIGIKEIENNPGSNRDISKVIQSFPGVGGGVSFRNDVIIRGGGPSENSFYLDDIEIPNINHFATQGASGGPVGILNADLLGGVNFYSGAFPANRGNALSGIFEFSQIDGNREKLRFRGAIGASEVSTTFDSPIGKKSSIVFSARRSYLQFLFDALGLPFLPTFNDYQLKFKSRLDDKNELSIISIGAYDISKLNTGIAEPDESQTFILAYLPNYEQWNYAIGGVWKHYEESGYHTTVLSRNMLNNTSYKYPENNENLPKIYDYTSQEIENKFRYEYTTRINKYRFNIGTGSEYAKYNNNTSQQFFAQGRVVEQTYGSEVNIFKYSAFGQASTKFYSERLTTSFGLRLDGNNYSSHMSNPLNQFSPRLSLSYAINGKINANFNSGRYYQLPAYTTLGYRDEMGVLTNKTNNIKYIGVNHFIGGFDYTPLDYIFFSIEGFFKQYNQYPLSVRDGISLATKGSDFGVIGDEEIISIGKGKAYGAEFMNRIQAPNGFTSIISYTWVRSLFENLEGKEIPTNWDSKHLLTITSLKKINTFWQIGGKFRFVGGTPYTPYDLENSAIVEVWNAYGRPIPNYTKLNSERFSAASQLDIRIDRSWYFSKWSLMIYTDIQNVLNSKSDQPDIVLRETDENNNFIIDNNRYKLRSIANNSGTILPSIGIMIEF